MGSIHCNKCKKVMKSESCACGWTKCHIVLWLKRKRYRIWKFHDNMLMDYDRADATLKEIRTAMLKGRGAFRIADYLDSSRDARKVHNVIDAWLAAKDREVKRGVVHPGSIRTINVHLNLYILPHLGDHDVRDIDQEEISIWFDALPDKHSLKYRKNVLATLHSFMTWLFGRGTIKVIPAFPEVELSQEKPKPRVALTMEQQLELMQLIPERHRPIMEFGMETGLRVGELITLKVKDIGDGSITVGRTLSGNVVIETTKGNSSGASSLQVKELARHTDVRMTQKYYHGETSRLRSIVNNRGAIVKMEKKKEKEG